METYPLNNENAKPIQHSLKDGQKNKISHSR
jgi:Na+/melibiose symporter-like transporter